MSEHSDIVIAGGGLNGLTLGLGLTQAGFTVTIVDSSRFDPGAGDFNGRGYALALTSKRLLAAIGIWDSVSGQAQPMLDIKVSDGRAGEGPSPLFLHFDHAEIEEGPMGFMIEDRFLRPALHAAVAKSNIDLIEGQSIVSHSVAPGGVSVDLDSGKSLTAKLLIGCDGRASPTGKRAGIRRLEWHYDQSSIVCALEHDRPHNGIAHQFFMPSGPLAILPLPGNRSSIVWTETTAEAQRISQLDDADFIEALKPSFGSFLGNIALAGHRAVYPLGLSIAQSFVRDRIALAGDAAHSVHPIAGQGLNAGLRDIAALIEVLQEARTRGEDVGTLPVLGRYQSWRRFDTAALGFATDGFNRLFSNDSPSLRGLRDLGMGIVQRLPGLKRNFIREAAGLTGDLPKLMM